MISIITINKNHAAGLRNTLDSVRRQMTRDHELVVVDGLSSDDSIDVIRQNEDIITKWVSESDKGIYDAFNKAIAYSTGDHILFLNSGDMLLEPDSLRKLSAKIRPDDLILVWDIFSQKGVWKVSPNVGSHLVNKFLGHTGTALFSRRLFDELGMYDTGFKLLGDREFYYRALRAKGSKVFRKIDGLYSEFENNGGTETNMYRSATGPREKEIIHERYPDVVKKYSYSLLESYYHRFRKRLQRMTGR